MLGNMKTAQRELAAVTKQEKMHVVPKMLISFYNQSLEKKILSANMGSGCQTSASTTENGSFTSEKGGESVGLPEIVRAEKIFKVDSVTPVNRPDSRQGKDIVIRKVAMSKSQLKPKGELPRQTSPNYSQLLREGLSSSLGFPHQTLLPIIQRVCLKQSQLLDSNKNEIISPPVSHGVHLVSSHLATEK
jgi:hypothetical protein